MSSSDVATATGAVLIGATHDNSADAILSKMTNEVGSTESPYVFADKETYHKSETMTWTVRNSLILK
jgi:hypothetical protein